MCLEAIFFPVPEKSFKSFKGDSTELTLDTVILILLQLPFSLLTWRTWTTNNHVILKIREIVEEIPTFFAPKRAVLLVVVQFVAFQEVGMLEGKSTNLTVIYPLCKTLVSLILERVARKFSRSDE